MYKSIGISIALIPFIFSIATVGTASNFIDIQSMFMVLAGTLGLMLFKYGNKALIFWKLPDSQRTTIANWSGKTCMHVGITAAVVGYIQIANNLKDLSMIGPALAIASITILYSYFGYLFIFRPFVMEKVVIQS